MEGDARRAGQGRDLDIPQDLRPQCHNLDRSGQQKGGQVLNISEKQVAIPGLTGITCGFDNEGKSGCPGQACPSGPPGKCKFPFPAFNSRFFRLKSQGSQSRATPLA